MYTHTHTQTYIQYIFYFTAFLSHQREHPIYSIMHYSFFLTYGCVLERFFKNNFTSGYVGLHCCVGFFLVAVSGGCSLVAMCRLLIVLTSFVEPRLSAHRLQ